MGIDGLKINLESEKYNNKINLLFRLLTKVGVKTITPTFL